MAIAEGKTEVLPRKKGPLSNGWLIAGDQRQDYRKKSCKPGLLGKVQEQTQVLKLEGS